MTSAERWMLALAIAGAAACGARTELRMTPIDAGAGDAGAGDAAAGDALVGTACGCPGTAGFRRCVLPLMCCPVTRTCEDPSRFRCTGQTPPACP